MARAALLKIPLEFFYRGSSKDFHSPLLNGIAWNCDQLVRLGVTPEILRYVHSYWEDFNVQCIVYRFVSSDEVTSLPLCAQGQCPMELTIQDLNSCFSTSFEKEFPWEVRTAVVPVLKEIKCQRRSYRRISQE